MAAPGRLRTPATAIFLVFSTVAVAFGSTENPAAPTSPGAGGVVTSTAWVNTLLRDGVLRSPTFAGITSQLQELDVVATVEPALQIKSGLSGYTMFITRTPLRRYVRIYFDPRLQRCQQIAIIGHELRHALEVALHPQVVNQATMKAMYQEHGHGEGDRWDTEGAIQAGKIILRELTSLPAQAAIAVNADDDRER